MSQKNRIITAAFATLLAALMLGGCGSGNREGQTQGGNTLFGGVATVGDTACNQCHSANAEALTGETLIAQYQLYSPHNVDGLGCESCHGGGAGHNGVGPIPFPLGGETPLAKAQRCETCHDGVQTLTVNGVATVAPASNATDFATSNHATMTLITSGLCIRCHTHEGAVLSDASGFTGDGTVLSNVANGPPLFTGTFSGIKCETCHQHGGGLRIVKAPGNTLWDPNGNARVDQFDLCTSCHTLTDNAGTLLTNNSTLTGGIATGTIVSRHANEWYRMLASTHYDNPNTGVGLASNVVEGYVVKTSSTNACYDCHGHEAMTETNPSSADLTIHKDWAESAHAGRVLEAKYTATTGLTGSAAVTAALNAGATDDVTVGGPGWTHYNWDDTSSRGSCQACHTSTGISNYLATQTTDGLGYDANNNDFSHLDSWSATGGSNQNELLYCWGCHSNSGTGALRKTDQAILTYPEGQPVVISGAGKSTVCIVCHGGRGSVSDTILNDLPRSTRFNGHHAPTAAVVYAAQTHLAYEFPGLSYANTAYRHSTIGTGTNGSGPCASCHMPTESHGKSHSFEALEHDSLGAVTAIRNQALCNTCHAAGGLTTPIAPADMTALKDGYAEASTILNNYVGNVAGFANYLGYAITSSNYNNQNALQPVGDNDYGAYQNAKLNGDEPCAYVHNGLYARRVVFDAIDWMDNGFIDGTITFDAAAFPAAAAWLNAPTGTATRP